MSYESNLSQEHALNTARRLSVLLLGLMALQGLVGLAFRGEYRDVDWITTTWFGNDGVTLLLACPLLAGALLASARGSLRGLLVWLGLLGYALYNYAFYLFGASLNAFFPLYLVLFVLAGITLILALAALPIDRVVSGFRERTPVRIIGFGYAGIAVLLSLVWLGLWAAYVFAGRPLPVELAAFQVVAVLDLALMVPALLGGGLLLWRRRRWGFVVAAIAGVQGTLYLVVLSVNSLLLIRAGLAEAPGELPIWGGLFLVTLALTWALLAGAESEPRVDGGRTSPSGY